MDIKAQGAEALLGRAGGLSAGLSGGFSSRGATRGSGQNFELKASSALGRNLSFYRRTAFPTNVGDAAVVAKGRGGGKEGGVSSFGETLFRRKVTNEIGGNEIGGRVRGGAGDEGAIGVGQRALALQKAGGVLSGRFVADNPLLAPAPVALPSLEALSAGGGVLGLPNGELGGGGLSVDLLRALQKYRVAAEAQG